MFWTLLNRMLAAPLASCIGVLALLVIAAQLYAMGSLAQGQVQKAHLRDSLQISANTALANCFLYSKGAALSQCRSATLLAQNP